jgi:hypothetical protein
MGQGLGPAQKAMLAALEDPGELAISELADMLGLSMRRARTVAHSLADRNLAVLTKEALGWKGVGEYGILVQRSQVEAWRRQKYLAAKPRGGLATRFMHLADYDVDALPGIVVKAGEEIPGRQRMTAAMRRHGMRPIPKRVWRDTECVYIGMPVYGLMVSEIEWYRQRRAIAIEASRAGREMFGVEPMTEDHIIEHYGPEV